MNEYIVDGQVYQVSDDKLEKFLKEFPNAKLKEESIEPVKTTPVEMDATAGKEIVSDTESILENGSLESTEISTDIDDVELDTENKGNLYQGVVAEMKSRKDRGAKNMLLNERKGDDSDFESMDFKKETGLTFLDQAKRSAANLRLSLSSGLNDLLTAAAIGIGTTLGIEGVEEFGEQINEMDYDTRQKTLNSIFDAMPGVRLGNAKAAYEHYEKTVAQTNLLQKEMTQFDNTIGQAFAQGDFIEGATRAVSAAIGSLPFMAQAMIPIVGIPSIVAGEATAASKEAQREGDDLDMTLMGYSAVIGASEGLLEVVSRGIGRSMFKNLLGQSKNMVKESLTKVSLKLAKDAGLEGLSESATLTINNAAEAYFRKDEKAWDGYVLELIDTFIIGATSGAGPSGVGKGYRIVKDGIEGRQLNKELDKSNYKSLTDAFSSEKEDEGSIGLAENKYTERFLDFDLKNQVASGEITIEKSKEIKKNFYQTQGAANQMKFLGITGDAKVEAVELLTEKARLQKIVDTADKAGKPLVEGELSQIETINNRLREVAAFKRDKDVGTTKEFAKKLGFELVQDQTVDDLTKIAPKGFNAETDYGFIQGNKIYLNNSIIGKTNEVKTASHELLHGILTKSILDGDMTKESVEKFIKNSFGQKQFNSISKTMKAMGYDQAYLEKRPDEYLTQLYEYDMLSEAGSFEKVARFVEGIISKITGGRFNPTFTNKNDLGLFLREYKKSIESGVMSEKLKESKFFPTDKDGNIIKAKDTDITALSKPKITPKAQEFINLNKEGVITNEALVDIINSPSSTSVDKFGAIEAVVEANWPVISNAIKFNPTGSIPMDAVKTAITEQIQGIFPGRKVPLFKSYNESQGKVNTVISSFLRPRQAEILERAKKIGGITQEGASVDSKEAKQIKDNTTEKLTEQVATKPVKAKESLRKKIKLNDATSKKVVDAVVKTFGTKLPPADSKQFKQALQKAFKTELKTTIAKDVLGSRVAYETFLRDNFETIIEALPQDVINKRFRPFAEDTGKREKTKEGKKIFKKKNITKAEFIKYFLGRDVGTSTKGTRKDALAEALAQEFATDATMQTIQRPDVKEKREFVDKTQTTEKVSKAIDRPVDYAFSKAVTEQNLDNLKKKYPDLDPSIFDPMNPKTKEGVNRFITIGTTIVPEYIPIKMFERVKELANAGKKESTRFKRGLFLTSGKELQSFITLAKRNEKKFSKKDVENLMFAATNKSFVKDYTAKEIQKNYNGLKFFLKQLQKMVNEKPETAAWVAAYFNTGPNAPMILRSASMPIGRQLNIKKGQKKEKEHVFPANEAADLMFDMILEDKVDEYFPVLREMYFQIEISKVNDNKLSKPPKFSFKTTTPEVFKQGINKFLKSGNKKDLINILVRYFNPLVNNNEGGFNPNDLIILGKSVAETFDVQVPANLQQNPNVIAKQQEFIYRKLVENIVGEKVDIKEFKNFLKLVPSITTASVVNNNMLPVSQALSKAKNFTNTEVLNKMKKLDKEASDARTAFSKGKNLNKDFNDIIERATGIGTEKRYGQTKARAVGADKGRFDLLGIPPSAQDFVGLTRYFAGKGKQGDATIAWIKENFLDPFARANIDISNSRVALANDFKALKQLLGVSPKDLNKKITGEPYTVGNAVRVYAWVQQGMKIPGLSKADQKILEDYVTADKNLVTFANELIAINKDNGYPKPQDSWLAGTITTDLLSGLNTVVRAKYLEQWQGNVNEVFNETNMNKLEAAYGKGYREALEDILSRMKSGSNRGAMGDTLTGRFVDWLNGSVGAIMFFNMRSAVLQTISAVNFVNLSDNNILKAAAAFGNQPQYWSDVIKLMNSDYLVERRNGLKININEADIAEIAAESKNKAKAFINKLLKLGFLPTQIADSFAIASGGATFYRNRYKSLKKEGLSDKDAEAQAFQDFREIAEESQQSSRPDRISKQQAGPMGRVILAFANTPAQYARLMQKAASDLKNRRGDDKTNISKILYYGAIQNVIFNALQQALFAMAFSDEEPDEEKLNKKYTGIVNGMADSLLRGIGFHGAAISTLKNVIMKLADGAKAQDAAIEILDISPPISSKVGKLRSAGRTWDWNKKEIMEKGWSLDNPAYLAAGQVVSATTNLPLDRGIRKLQNLREASNTENEEWMRIANALGWAKWELEWQKDKPKKKSKSLSRRRSSKRSTKTSSKRN